jgi:hypothetical protein
MSFKVFDSLEANLYALPRTGASSVSWRVFDRDLSIDSDYRAFDRDCSCRSESAEKGRVARTLSGGVLPDTDPLFAFCVGAATNRMLAGLALWRLWIDNHLLNAALAVIH